MTAGLKHFRDCCWRCITLLEVYHGFRLSVVCTLLIPWLSFRPIRILFWVPRQKHSLLEFPRYLKEQLCSKTFFLAHSQTSVKACIKCFPLLCPYYFSCVHCFHLSVCFFGSSFKHVTSQAHGFSVWDNLALYACYNVVEALR